jgi:muramoyltetrapeptide carboxypeptidase
VVVNEIFAFSPASVASKVRSWLDDFSPTLRLTPSLLTGENWHGFAGRDQDRARELEDLLIKEPRFLMGSCGGFGSVRMMRHLSVKAGQAGVICGFSDLTALINYLPLQSKVHAFHGPLIGYPKTLVPGGWLERSFSAFFVEDSGFEGSFQGQILNGSSLDGPLIGGNLSVLCSLFGTSFAPPLAGKILILEEINEATYRVDRLLNQLSLQPGFQELSGIVLGAFRGCNPSPPGCSDLPIGELLSAFASSLSFPVVMNAPFGHLDDFMVLPMFGDSHWEAHTGGVKFSLLPPWGLR